MILIHNRQESSRCIECNNAATKAGVRIVNLPHKNAPLFTMRCSQ